MPEKEQNENEKSEVESQEAAKEKAVEEHKTPSKASKDPSVVYVGSKPQ